MLRKAQKRAKKVKDNMAGIVERAADAESAYKRAQRTYDEAKKRCTQLKAQGEDVPEDGEKDLSAPGAWKPPGIQAAKDRSQAKAALAKAKAVWEKVSVIAEAKQSQHKALKDK